MAINLANEAKKREIKYFLISFVDLLGQLRAKLVPAGAIGGMQETGAGFAGFAAWMDMTPADPDMFAIPDPESLAKSHLALASALLISFHHRLQAKGNQPFLRHLT